MAWEERGWRIMRRVRRGMRRPGARHSFDCGDYEEDYPLSDFGCCLYEKNFYRRYYPKNIEGSRLDRYLASKCSDLDHYDICRRSGLLTTMSALTERQSFRLSCARHVAPDDSYLLKTPSKCGMAPCPPGLNKEIRHGLEFVGRGWRFYLKERMCYIREWFNRDAFDDYEDIPTPEQQRQFEKDAWYWDQYHWRLLAARRRVARLLVLTILRSAAKQRAIALYWQEQTQRALCAPGGAGRAADRGTFESEFA